MIQSHRLVAKDTEKLSRRKSPASQSLYIKLSAKKSTPALSHRELNENFDTFLETKK